MKNSHEEIADFVKQPAVRLHPVNKIAKAERLEMGAVAQRLEASLLKHPCDCLAREVIDVN